MDNGWSTITKMPSKEEIEQRKEIRRIQGEKLKMINEKKRREKVKENERELKVKIIRSLRIF